MNVKKIGVTAFLERMDAFHAEISDLCNMHSAPTKEQMDKIIRLGKKKRVSKSEAKKAAKGWHAPGADKECEECKPIFELQQRMEKFEEKHLGTSRAKVPWTPDLIALIQNIIRMEKE